MFHAEFIGIPGSGKSTIRSLLLEEMGRKGLKLSCMGSDEALLRAAREKIDRPYRLILNSISHGMARVVLKRIGIRSYFHSRAQNKFLSRYGGALRLFLESSQFQKMSFEDREVVIDGFLSAGSTYLAIKEGPEFDGLVLFDEGLIQKSMMFVSGLESPIPPKETLKNYLSNIPNPDLVIYITADANRCRERMGDRPKGLTQRLKEAGPETILKFLGNAQLHMDSLIDELEGKGETKILKFTNNGNSREIISSLIASLPLNMVKGKNN